MIDGNLPKKLGASGPFKQNHCPWLSIGSGYDSKTLLLFQESGLVLLFKLRTSPPVRETGLPCHGGAEPSAECGCISRHQTLK